MPAPTHHRVCALWVQWIASYLHTPFYASLVNVSLHEQQTKGIRKVHMILILYTSIIISYTLKRSRMLHGMREIRHIKMSRQCSHVMCPCIKVPYY